MPTLALKSLYIRNSMFTLSNTWLYPYFFLGHFFIALQTSQTLNKQGGFRQILTISKYSKLYDIDKIYCKLIVNNLDLLLQTFLNRTDYIDAFVPRISLFLKKDKGLAM